MEGLRPIGTRIQIIRGASAQKLLDAITALLQSATDQVDSGIRPVSVSRRPLSGSMEWIEIRFSEKIHRCKTRTIAFIRSTVTWANFSQARLRNGRSA